MLLLDIRRFLKEEFLKGPWGLCEKKAASSDGRCRVWLGGNGYMEEEMGELPLPLMPQT